jgi:hypothetical protein
MRVVNEEGADLDCCGGEGVPSDVGGRSKPSEGGTDGKAKEERLAEVAQERRARPRPLDEDMGGGRRVVTVLTDRIERTHI